MGHLGPVLAECGQQPYVRDQRRRSSGGGILILAGTAKNSAFNGLILYTPIAGTQSGGAGLPQEFLATTLFLNPAALC